MYGVYKDFEKNFAPTVHWVKKSQSKYMRYGGPTGHPHCNMCLVLKSETGSVSGPVLFTSRKMVKSKKHYFSHFIC